VGEGAHRAAADRAQVMGDEPSTPGVQGGRRLELFNCSHPNCGSGPNAAKCCGAVVTSLKQIEANRRNALKSTGPITEEGKERSRCNAVRHGLTAETVIGSLEDADDYAAFEAAVIADYDADTAVQRELVLRLASILWRLRRSTAIESALFEAMAGDRPSSAPPSRALGKVIAISSRTPGRGAAESEYSVDTAVDHFVCAPQELARAFIRLTAHATFPLDRLSRYEHMLWRQARQLVTALKGPRRRLQFR
jgi:hypothetical protein